MWPYLGWFFADLGQAGEFKEGPIPSDFFLEILDGGGCRNPQMFDLGNLGKV
jgi:hypothetical protein